MAMDAKDLRTESAVSERNNDGSKYTQSGGISLHCDRNKSYQDMGSNSLGKVDVPNARPCAVIGPDRVVPPPAASEAYHIKKGPADPWPCMDNAYRRPPEYPHKLSNFQNPTRNISPRQTFQENMQRIMVPPTYSSIKINDDTTFAQMSDRSNGLSKNIKLNMPPEAKFCDVPYAVNPNTNEQKNVRNPEMCLPSVNPTLTRTAPHGWPPGSVNLRSTRMYGAPELYQYQEYPSCAGTRPIVPRPHRTVPDDQTYVYGDPYYQDGNIRFKPYPSVKERYPQQRYEYIGNYSNPFHPPPGFPPHKYELQKSIQPHPYPPYPSIKYLDSRVAEPVMEGYQRNPQSNYNVQYRNQVIHPNYGPVLGNCPQNKLHSYPPDAHLKTIAPNKLPYDNNTKAYIEYENNRPKLYPMPESYFVNEMTRLPMKSQVVMPNYSTLNMHNIPPNTFYKKDSQQIKNYEHMAHFRNIDPNLNVHNPMSRHAPVFSPNTLAISPTDSNTSNDTTQTLGTSQEDCGYVSQSSNASVRSMDSGINRIQNDYLRKYYDNRYGPIARTSPMMSKPHSNSNNNRSKDKKQIDVRQFLQMWNEGDEEAEENSSKEIVIQTGSSEKTNFGKTHEAMNNQEQLYVLGLVNVPSEELAKYEHIQKVSKLPENIKGYNSIELLNQFEEVIESSNMNNYKTTAKEFQMSMKGVIPKGVIPPRSVSPLDVEAQISQSVIHKEVGCNFEIKPCSPTMLNVEVAAPVLNILGERSIEKVANPVIMKSPMLNGMDENVRIPSCKMINTQFSNSNPIDPIKSSYSLQDLESNSGICLASLPRLDNDIELNFPEVNQQFINANKGDSTVMTNSLRDLPTLEILDHSDSQNKDNFDRISSRIDVNKSPYIVESEKEFSKLSKYRKTKSTSSEPKENPKLYNTNAVRTDSVIIKNPENIKNCEENSEFSSNTLCKEINDIQAAPINLTSQGSLSNVDSSPLNIDRDEDRDRQLPVEIAIDFSLNKTGILDSTECTETINMVSQNETPIQLEENHLNTIIQKQDASVILEENKDFLSIDKNSSPVCEIGTECNPESNQVTDFAMNDLETNAKGTPSRNEFYTNTDNEVNKSASEIKKVEDMILDDSNNPSSVNISTEIPNNELLSGINIHKCVNKEVDKCEEPPIDESSQKAKYTYTDEGSDSPQIQTNNVNDKKYEIDTDTNSTKVAKICETDNILHKLNCSDHIKTKLDIGSTEINNHTKIDSVVTNETQLQSTDYNRLLLPNEEIYCNDCEDRSDTIQSQNSESRHISKDMMAEETNNEIEVENTTPLLEEHSDHESNLKDFEEKYCDDRLINSPVKSDECSVEKTSTESAIEESEMPVTRYLSYSSKELYSPWIQKLLMFLEGPSNNKPTEADNNGSDDFIFDTIGTETVCEYETTNILPFEQFSGVGVSENSKQESADRTVNEIINMNIDAEESEEEITDGTFNEIIDLNIGRRDSKQKNMGTSINEIIDINIGAEDSKQESVDETLNEIIDMNVGTEVSKEESADGTVNDIIDEPILNGNMVETEYDKFEAEDSSKIETQNTNNGAHGTELNINDAETVKENEVIIPSLKCELNGNENINSNSETPSASSSVNHSNIDNQFELSDTSSNLEHNFSESFQKVSETRDENPKDKKVAQESSPPFGNVPYSCNRMQGNEFAFKKCQPLKRSLSDSALNIYNNDERQTKQENEENVPLTWPFKRRKVNNMVDKDLLAQNLCNIIHNNRRNSISSIYTEENVSFCILIDNSCIITEEENEEPEKMCYTELSEDCLAEIQNNCIKFDENMDTLPEDVSSPQHENPCDYSDSFVLECEEEKTLEESWVEDVACVETVISDDIAEDIEICGPSFPKDDVLSDNDESGVFSSNEHTDKVKYIYGDKMCNDDALFVETLYKTPQMDVNKTLYSRETHVSEDYERYYDNDSLEKMLSESNEQELSPYVPEYMESIFSSEVVSSKETPENKENMNIETYPSFPSKDNALDIVVDDENVNSIDFFSKTRDDTVNSCESSIDNVFTYNQKDEDTIYTSSSSPEVSSTTSEEKNSGILLKITNYKGSRISQINDINRVNKRSSCKFTEDKEYLQSHSSFPTNRPLLTKAAQKYIPPLKESIRDLKVKLSLPQHSLMKLKQLKISKDEPKVYKQNATPPLIPKKPKPKFEDVLKSIDEIQFKMHKEKTKKTKKCIPKVVIKKNQNGSHYASTSNQDDFNPDLTGRKWQPWVFIEKSHFIDKMAIKKKTKAVYSHRKRTYVLAEKFQKYRSVSSAKFVISPPISDNASKGLKYTIRLKHSY